MVSVRVAVVDDHEMFRESLRSVLDGRDGIEIVAGWASAEDMLAGLAAADVDVLLMDLTMPGVGGVAATRQVLAGFEQVRVVVVSMLDDRASVLAALDAGAAGYVTKASSLADIVRTILAVHAGQLSLTGDVGQHLIDASRGAPDGRFTARERELLPMLAEAATTTQMATRLGVAEKTVRNYLSTLYLKLGASDRASAVLAACRVLE